MSVAMSDISVLLNPLGVPHFDGYPASDTMLPYVANRPLIADYTDLALNGDAIAWDTQFTLYCAAGSVTASYNLAIAVIGAVHGKRVGNTTLAASMGYSGAQVEGHYESQVTVQLNQGGI